MPTNSIILNASNIAGLIGKHPFLKRGEAFMAAWKSSDKKSYYDAHKRNGVLTIEQERRNIRRASPFITNMTTSTPSLMDVVEKSGVHFDDASRREFSSTSSSVESSDVMREARRVAFTRYGEERERSIIDRVRDILPKYEFVHRDAMMRRVIGRAPSGREFVLQGKVDGMSSDGKTVLECKTRMHKLFMALREYEDIQIRAYLRLIPGASNAVLAEAYFGNGRDPDVNIIFVEERQDEGWLDLLRAVAHVLDRVLDDTSLQDSIVTAKNRSLVLQHLIQHACEKLNLV